MYKPYPPSREEQAQAYLARLHETPEELKQVKRWAIYRIEGKRKVPRSPKAGLSPHYRYLSAIEKPELADGSEGSWKDSPYWLTYDEVVQAWEVHGWNYHGVGFLLADDDPIHVTDLDALNEIEERNDKETSDLIQRDVFEKQSTYIERSPSGTGAHVIGKARKADDMGSQFHVGPVKVESYDRDRFVTFTGDRLDCWGPSTIGDVQAWVDEYVPRREIQTTHSVPGSLGESDRTVLERAFAASRGNHYRKLYEGDKEAVSRYHSRSEAEEVLIRALAFQTRGDVEQIKRIMLSSRLSREKWEENKGYLERSIDKAIEYCRQMPEEGITPFYDPEYSSKARYMPALLALWAREGDFHQKAVLMALIRKLEERWLCYGAGDPFDIYGKTVAIPVDGIIVFAALRYIGPWIGKNDAAAVSRILKPIRTTGPLQRLAQGRANKASCYLIPLSSLPGEEPKPSIQHGRGTQGLYCPHTPEFLYHVVDSESPEANDYLRIVWTPSGSKSRSGLNNPQKVLLQQVLYTGMTGTSELLEFFRSSVLPGKSLEESAFGRKYLEPLVDLGLLLVEGEGVRPTEDFEENLDRLYIDSGGERNFEAAKEKFQKERESFAEKGANPHDEEEEHRRIEAVLAGELPWENLSEWERTKAEDLRAFEIITSLSGRSG